MNILITGGAGYIGSHTFVALSEAGFAPVILDNFSNSHRAVLPRLRAITERPVPCEAGDVLDTAFVQESVANPLKYYHNNLVGAVSLLVAMEAVGCQTLVFSSSATVYGNPASVPIAENFPRSHTNPYGHTKLVIEDMLTSQCAARLSLRVAVLRYFNPAGAHPSGLIGEDPAGTPTNLMPCIAQVASGQRPYLQVFGGDYPTPDGTGVRDYIHVCDLAEGHVAALKALLQEGQSLTVNLGTGRGHSVLEVVRAFEVVTGQRLPYEVMPRRPGDVAQCYADPSLAQQRLGRRRPLGDQHPGRQHRQSRGRHSR